MVTKHAEVLLGSPLKELHLLTGPWPIPMAQAPLDKSVERYCDLASRDLASSSDSVDSCGLEEIAVLPRPLLSQLQKAMMRSFPFPGMSVLGRLMMP